MAHPTRPGDDAADLPPNFARSAMILGLEGLRRLQSSAIMIIGLGAVGSYATEALARAGVGTLYLVDFDSVQASNINRQLFALHSTIGQAKTEVARQRVLDINPACQVHTRQTFVNHDTLPDLLALQPDFILDAIDSLNPKVNLLQAATQAHIPIVASMGAARRSDPSAIRISDINDTERCPLARAVRKALRRRGIHRGIPCVYSVEEALDATADEDPTHETAPPRRGRHRQTLGSLPTLTGIFGLTAANLIIQRIVAREDLHQAPTPK